jgi:hypothetical protein
LRAADAFAIVADRQMTSDAGEAMKRTFVAIPLVVIALAGCGDDNNDDDAQTEAASSAEAIPIAQWIKQADAICQQTDERVGALEQPRDVEDFGRLANEVQALVAAELEQLRELAPPQEIAEDVEEMLSLQELEVDAFDEVEEAASTGDQATLESALEESEQPGNEANQIAESLGLEECEEPYG